MGNDKDVFAKRLTCWWLIDWTLCQNCGKELTDYSNPDILCQGCRSKWEAPEQISGKDRNEFYT